jgi:regulator of PEP synthase PpsR (kinase-PPPase family)
MNNTYQIYLISDSTGETLDRVFLAIKAQFKDIEYDVKSYFFTRTENQVLKIMEEAKEKDNSIILYTIVDISLAKFLANKGDEKKIPCFSVLGNLIMNFSRLLNQKASHVPSGQHALNEEYYERIEAIQFTMAHDDGNLVEDISKADLVLLGVSRTSKTPTSIYLANRGFKTLNIPLVNELSIPKGLKKDPKLTCVVGLTTEPERLVDIRKNRMSTLKETENTSYTNIKKIEKEINDAKKTFIKYGWPTIDVTRKSVEETAASIIKIHEIYKNNA